MNRMTKAFSKAVAVSLIALLSFSSTAYAAQTVTYFHNDLLGSPVAATNQNGDVIWRENYQAFGEKVKIDDTAKGNNIGYTGHVNDADTGLTYMQARYYDPVLGRFYANDPVGYVENATFSFNRYVYAANNPFFYTDPTGLWVYGVNVGVGGTFGLKGAYSYQVLLDTEGNFAIQETIEGGVGLGTSGGVFANLLLGSPKNVFELEDWGASFSGSGWFIGGAFNLPLSFSNSEENGPTDPHANNIGYIGNTQGTEYKAMGTPGKVGEFGLSLSCCTPEGGGTATHTTTIFSLSLLGDIGRWLAEKTYEILH